MRSNDCPECRWVSVVDEAGRRRLEMRWQTSAPVAALRTAADEVSRAA
ncbi:hypothetical protein [Modestobacter sp. NPDC049651]